jgi:predicted nucleic acid-binding Zn ribbon protein
MVQIRRDGIEDFTCTHCGANYEISKTPARDSGSAQCDDCGTTMMKWVDSAIPLFRAKSAENAKRRYFISAHSRVAGR